MNAVEKRNPFGGRVSTKQTRNPPPMRRESPRDPSEQAWRVKPSQEKSHHYNSPPYTKSRDGSSRSSQRSKDLFPQKSTGQWKPKLVVVAEGGHDNNEHKSVPATGNQLALVPREPSYPPGISRETVMEELHEVTRQYLSCPDPIEAAARRQRVHFSDANGLMESTTASILASAATMTRTGYPPLQLRDCDSNPVTPPPLNEFPQDSWLLPESPRMLSPINRLEEDDGLEPLPSDASPCVKATPQGEKEKPTRLRSVIVSPTDNLQATGVISQGSPDEPREDETLRTLQNRIKRKTRKPAKLRSPRFSPNILRGASSKKRNLSQFQSSPGRSVGASERRVSRKQARKTPSAEAGPSHPSTNPPIQLIPAISRKKAVFRPLPDQVP